MPGTPNRGRRETRRSFLRKTALVTASMTGAAEMASLMPLCGQATHSSVSIVVDPDDRVAQQTPVQWAIAELRRALESQGFRTQIGQSVAASVESSQCVLAASRTSRAASQLFDHTAVPMPEAAEALSLVKGRLERRPILLACGSDARGLVYALLELADELLCATRPATALSEAKQAFQQPANRIRSIARLFASEVEDKGWFNDRLFWQRYLTELATHRFNRFALTLGLGYDFPTDIRDAYFHFAYPFLISVPGWEVRAVPLPEREREQNLEMLRFISEETARRGLHFQLGLWTHAYHWVNSPQANYVIEGLTPDTHANYCRDALSALLRACPAIGGVTFRIHGESGVAEGSYDFWRTVFAGLSECGRRVELDMHAKGMDEKMIELALATGMPVNISPKYWAEHMGLGYMQGAIRPQEMPPREVKDQGFFAKSTGSRRFLRYGYGDLLREDRPYGVLHRIWPGTQRLLLWGDPQLAADYGRASSFCGSAGVEWCEPLSFKGRKGSGLPGGRTAYADASLQPAEDDFEKFLYAYRVWGRRIYDPNCDPRQWRRYLRQQFGGAALSLETALGQASRILPLITTAHCPSAANNNYWPEMYTNMPIIDDKLPHPYGDTLSPKRFGAVSSLDPEFFSRVDDFAEALSKGESSAKYSPAWVAASLLDFAAGAQAAMAKGGRSARDSRDAQFRRAAADAAIQSGLGYFFAWKFRAATLFALYERTCHRPALEQALQAYRRARTAWAELAEGAKPIYRDDVTFGPAKFQRGHWLDRLPNIDADIADMARLLEDHAAESAAPSKADARLITQAIDAVLRPPPRSEGPLPPDFHVPPSSFRRGEPLLIEAADRKSKSAPRLDSLRLHFRRVNQSEAWQTTEMEGHGEGYHAWIPAACTDSPFPIQYYFVWCRPPGETGLIPGLKPGWQGQPYFVVRQG